MPAPPGGWIPKDVTVPVRARESRSDAHRIRAGTITIVRVRCAARHTDHPRKRQCRPRPADCGTSHHPLAGTPADHYLTSARSRTRGRRSLVSLPSPHPASRTRPGRFPALLAGVDRTLTGAFMGIQRCYLDGPTVPTRRRSTPCDCHSARESAPGGAVRILEPAGDALLTRRRHRDRPRRLCKVLDWPGGAWATLGTSGTARRRAPRSPWCRVVVAADRDPGGLRAAAALADRLESEGRTVTIEVPPVR